MRLRNLTSFLILTQLAAAVPVRADERPTAPDAPLVAIGSRVRLEAPGFVGGRIQGSLAALDAESVTITLEGETPLVVPRAAIRSLEVGLGRRKSRLRGAFVGALAGAAFGAFLHVDPESCRMDTIYQATYVADVGSDVFCSRSEAVASGAALFGLLGLAIGVPTESWGSVPVDRARIRVQPTRGGVGASLQLLF